MMSGYVNPRCECILPVVVGNDQGKRQLMNAVIDTGFSGFLTLPTEMISALDLPWSGSDVVTLGDGSETLFDFYTVKVIWDRQYLEIDVAESETESLLGMALLHGYRIQIDAIDGGSIKIEVLRSD